MSRKQINEELLAQALAASLKTPKELEKEAKIRKNYEEAIETIPESLFQVRMLYLDVNIRGLDFKAFIDTGAQVSVMSEQIAEICGLSDLIDTNLKIKIQGIGEQNARGRIHLIDVYVGTKVLPCSFTIVPVGDLKLILGLDMLKSHGCLIDLKKRCLILDDERIDFVSGEL